MSPLVINILTIGAAVVAICLVLFLARWIVRRVIRGVLSGRKRSAQALAVLDQNVRLVFALATGLAALGIAGAGSYLVFRGHHLPSYALELVRRIPPAIHLGLAIAAAKLAGVALGLLVALRLLRRLLAYLGERAKAYEGVHVNAEAVDRFFGALQRMLGRSAWIGFVALALKLLGASATTYDLTILVLRLYLILALGVAAWRGLDAIIELADALSKKYSSPSNVLRYYTQLTHLLPLLRRSIEYALYTLVGYLITLELKMHNLAAWGPRIITIIGVVLLARVAVEVGRLLSEELLLTRATISEEQRQRRLTILPLIRSAIKYGIYFSAGIMILKQLGINPMPVLAGAGIVGLAVGFGAQNLINDVVSGFFILFENTYLVGDWIKAGEAEGNVEAIDLRTTRVRDNAGRLHIVRNGRIQDVINYSKEFTFAVVEVGVAYESNLQQVAEVLTQVGQEVQASAPDVLEPMVIRGVRAFNESDLVLRTTTKVKPGKHRAVEFALRARIKEAFDAHGIPFPYPQRVIVTKTGAGVARDRGSSPCPVPASRSDPA
jgi:small-conductance mechanosensitive channel